MHRYPMNTKDQCECGKLKDSRAKQCHECRQEPKKEKVCPGCNTTLPIEDFSVRMTYGKTRRQSRCKACRAQYSQQRRIDNPEKVRASVRRYANANPEKVRQWAWRSRWKKMGFDPDVVKNFLESASQCEICGSGDNLVPDHIHGTTTLRGVLCDNCNFGIGQFKDDEELLRRASIYLQKRTTASAVE
jgi:hypothetical protein